MIAHPNQLVDRQFAVPGVAELADELRGHAVVPRVDQLLHRERAVAGVAHPAHVLRGDAVIARAREWHRRTAPCSPARPAPGRTSGVTPWSLSSISGAQRAEPVAERAHLAQIGGIHAVLTGANQLGESRLRIPLLGQLVQEREPDVVPRHLVLLAGRRPGKAALRELRREIRIRRERERAGANAAADDAFERKRAGVAPQPELNRSARARELRGRQPFQTLDGNVRAGGRIQFHQPQMDGAFRTGRTDLPRAGQPVLHGAAKRCRATRTRRCRPFCQARLEGIQVRDRTRDPVAGRLPQCRAGSARRRRNGRRGARQRNQQRGRERRPRDAHAHRRHAPVARGIEHGEHAAFELSWTRHADREGRRPMAAERVRDLEQMAGILTRPGARRDHAVVARQLALDAQAARDPPGGRMEPVDRAGRERQRLREAIVPRDVRQLVKDHGASSVLGPRVGHGRDQDGRPARAEGHRHAALAAAKQANGTIDAQAARRTRAAAASNPDRARRWPRAPAAGRSTAAGPGESA